MENKLFAPVLIPTLCRYKHFKNCVESLSKCTFASETDLIIGLDYPLKDVHRDGYEKICDYIPTIKGFKKVEVIKREHNFGARENFYGLVEYALTKYDCYISTEDDNIFSPNFLEYMNKGLNLYRDNEKVYSISGYNYPIDMGGYNKNIYSSHCFSAWGVARWKHKIIPPTRDLALSFVTSFSSSFLLFRKDPRLLLSLILMLNQHEIYGDTIYHSFSIINDLYSIFPTRSKVRNLGNDSSGIHCHALENDKFSNQEIDKDVHFIYDNLQLSDSIPEKLCNFFSIRTRTKFKTLLLLLPYLFKLKK